MSVPALPRRSVIALVVSSRATAVLATVLVVPGAAVTIALATSPLLAVGVIVIGAVVYGGIMVFLLRSGVQDPPAPTAVTQAELPRVVSIARQLAWQAPLLGAAYAALVYWAVGHPGQPPIGVAFALGAPAQTWYQYRRALRVRNDLGGDLYTTQFGWGMNRRSYVVWPEEDVAQVRAGQPAV